MARIAGIDLPKDKRIEIGLTYIYGIGRKSAKDILEKAGVNPDTRVKDLTDAEEQKLRDVIDNYIVEAICAVRPLWTSSASARSAATAACVVAVACPFTVSAPRPTPVPARVPRRPLRTRRSKEGYVNGC